MNISYFEPLLFSSVSIQKSKWDSSRSMRYNQDAQREEGRLR